MKRSTYLGQTNAQALSKPNSYYMDQITFLTQVNLADSENKHRNCLKKCTPGQVLLKRLLRDELMKRYASSLRNSLNL
jgi:hypothetical protein